MARGDRGEARRAKSGGFGAVPLGFATDAPRFRGGSFTSSDLQSDCPFFSEWASPLEIFRDRGKFMIIRPESVFRTAADDSFSAEF